MEFHRYVPRRIVRHSQFPDKTGFTLRCNRLVRVRHPLHQRRREKDLSIQIHGVAIRHRGDEVANSPPFGLINIIDAVHLQLTQFFYKYQRDPDLTK